MSTNDSHERQPGAAGGRGFGGWRSVPLASQMSTHWVGWLITYSRPRERLPRGRSVGPNLTCGSLSLCLPALSTICARVWSFVSWGSRISYPARRTARAGSCWVVTLVSWTGPVLAEGSAFSVRGPFSSSPNRCRAPVQPGRRSWLRCGSWIDDEDDWRGRGARSEGQLRQKGGQAALRGDVFIAAGLPNAAEPR